MKKLFLLSIAFIGLSLCNSSTANAQGVGINPSGNPPDNSAMVDISSTDKGLLIPRVVLQSASDAATITSPATSLLVYNLGTGGLAPAGYYYNSGTPAAPVWTKLVTGGGASGWSLNGNAGTDSTTNFIGTTDDQAFVVKTNNAERMRVNKTGNVGIGTASPQSALDVSGSLATRTTPVTLSSNSLITVGNSSHIILNSTGATYTTPGIFTLSNGQPGQYLVIELKSGYAAILNTGNMKLTAPAGLLAPYSVLYIKWDSDNAAWVELSRNNLMAPVFLNPPTSYNGKKVFTYTGSNQSLTLPGNLSTNYIYVKLWGAGGGTGGGCGTGSTHNAAGGAGAFVSGWLPVTPGSTLTVIVGGNGSVSSTTSVPGGFGGGGANGASSNVSGYNASGSGGGRSSIQITLGTDAVTAGGGGGGGVGCNTDPFGGGGGDPNGGNGGNYQGGTTAKGGTTTSGGAGGQGSAVNGNPGSALTGGSGASSDRGGGGGGGGYFGGGGGGGMVGGAQILGGGGGGSSYTANLTAPISNIAGASGATTGSWPGPNNTDVDYVSGVGGTFSPGLVVIYW